MIEYPQETPPHIRTARAQPPAAHRRRHSRPHHRRHGERCTDIDHASSKWKYWPSAGAPELETGEGGWAEIDHASSK